MSDFVVEHGIEIPARVSGMKCKYPWPSMEDGDSVFVPGKRSVSHAADRWLARHRPHLKAVRRREGEGFRIWFVARDS